MKGGKNKLNDHSNDHLAPTNLEEQKPVTAPANINGLSDKEIQDKAEIYSRVGGKMERFFTFQKNINKFKADRHKVNDNRIKQDVYFAKGERAGLQQSPHEVIKDDRNWMDQQKRDQFMNEQKKEYDKDGLKRDFTKQHKKLGKRHVFNHAHNKYRNKDMGNGMDKDR